MTSETHKIYSQLAAEEIPRLLSILDRNPFSPTYGCFSREFWLTRVKDFPDAIAQFGVLSLALVWAHDCPGAEHYYQNKEIKKWIIAGIQYWITIQHGDGSYDEFYPNERGWAGPTGFLLYAMLRSYELLGVEFPVELRVDFFRAVKKSAWFLVTRDEIGTLANHHAMALLPIYASYYHTKKNDHQFAQKLEKKFKERMDQFLSYCNPEGWSLEYDGADPGYLSATVSFLSKMQKYTDGTESWYNEIQEVINKAITFSSYFLYPNGSYAGTIGSRQTLHFYIHGYELQAQENSLAKACTIYVRQALHEGRLVPPNIQDDRYFLYRIPEFLEAYIDYNANTDTNVKIPCLDNKPFTKYFEQSKILIKNSTNHYIVLNLAKGGVLKVFDKKLKKLVLADDGMVINTNKNTSFTTQWIDSKYIVSQKNNQFTVSGYLHKIPYKYFRPSTMILFRLFMLAFGWNAKIADIIKGLIRNLLMTKTAKSGMPFKRTFDFDTTSIIITNHVSFTNKIAKIRIGGQFAARYVPQSRYFQIEELTNEYTDVIPDKNFKKLEHTTIFNLLHNHATNNITYH